MAHTIKDMSDERIVEKLQEWNDKIRILEHRTANILFNNDYRKASNNYKRYLREWARRDSLQGDNGKP